MDKRVKKKTQRHRLTSEDLKRGFIDNELPPVDNYLSRHKKRTGIAQCERVLVRWK